MSRDWKEEDTWEVFSGAWNKWWALKEGSGGRNQEGGSDRERKREIGREEVRERNRRPTKWGKTLT